MQLSVYTINHPLVMNWSNYILNAQLTESEHFTVINKIGMSLIYEATRKSIKVQQIYLKQLEPTVDIKILPKYFNCTFITDLYLSQALSKDIKDFIPLSQIYTLNSDDEIMQLPELISLNSSQNININNTIIVIEKSLKINKISNILDDLLSQQISIQNIQICCITCTTSALQALGNKYSNLNIYTTQIIDDNNN